MILNNDSNYDIFIEFVPFDINDGSLAKAYPPNHKKEGVIEIDLNENWNFTTPEEARKESRDYFILLSIAIHEIGRKFAKGSNGFARNRPQIFTR